MLSLMLLGPVNMVIVDPLLVTAFFLVARPFHGSPSDKLLFLALVLKLN